MREGIYIGEVVHKRLRPCEHELRYRVFAVLFDCSRLCDLDRRLRLFSYNRFNLFGLNDADHGDGRSLAIYLREIAQQAGLGDTIDRFGMLCYPRILGYAFNPLTVFFGYDRAGEIRLVVYEVNNTFGERMTYVVPAEPAQHGVIAQSCAKELYVSPFNTDRGSYSFRLTPPGDEIAIAVALRCDGEPLLKAHFRGNWRALSDRQLMAALARTGWMTVKVIFGIHLEAARLWFKGLRPVPRPAVERRRITYISPRGQGQETRV